MALASKKTRRITVEGVVYHWVVAPNDGFIVLLVELADEPGQRLEAFFDYHDVQGGPSREVGQLRSITPVTVRTVLLDALARGWQAARQGLPPFRLHDAERLVGPADV